MNFTKIIIFAFISVLISTSCNDYLDVSPKTEVIRDELFEQEDGFIEALTGAYIALKKDALYGQAMTITTLEHLISNWDVSSNSTTEKLNFFQYDDEDVEIKFSSIYSNAYNVIAQVNAILEYIDVKKEEGVFTTPGLYELIKGECLAIRAYCHFDMLRLFGPVPIQASTSAILPYMKELTKESVIHINYENFKSELLKDVVASMELLSKDPIKDYSISTLRSGNNGFAPKNDYFTYRDVKFNYYAVVALKARMHLWFGEKSEAYSLAMEVIDVQDPSEDQKFPLGESDDMAADDLQLSSENVLGLYVYDLPSTSSDLFENGALTRTSTLDFVQNNLYESSASDIRSAYLWEVINGEVKSFCTLKKYKNGTSDNNKDIKTLPLIRISELYFIAIECAEDHLKANELWNAFQIARNIPVADLPEDQTGKVMQIIKEYRKEFFAEGQAFFAYKRLNFDRANMLWVPGTAIVNYVVPLPKTELVSNN